MCSPSVPAGACNMPQQRAPMHPCPALLPCTDALAPPNGPPSPQAAQRALNLPGAGYSSDAALMAQLHRVQTVGQMRQLLEGMLLTDSEPWQPAGAAAAAQLDSPQVSGEPSDAQSEGAGSTHSVHTQRGRGGAPAAAAAAAPCRLRHRRKQPSPARSPAPDEGMAVGQGEEGQQLPAKRLRISSRRWADE